MRCLNRSTREERIDGVARVTRGDFVLTRVVVDSPLVLQSPRLIEHEDVGHGHNAERLRHGLRVAVGQIRVPDAAICSPDLHVVERLTDVRMSEVRELHRAPPCLD